MTDYCGIDFGTSNSTLGLYLNGEVTLVELEDNHKTIPSAIFYSEESSDIHFGRKALNYYTDFHHGRLLRSFKSVLGSALMNETTQVAGKNIYFSEIIETFIRELKETAEKKHNVTLKRAVIGRPIHFVDNNMKRDKEAQESLKQAALKAGFEEVEFQYEPIAASLKYESSLEKDKTVMIIDIGGGTSDISIIKLSPNKIGSRDRAKDCLANTGVHIGGTNFDSNLSLNCIMPLLGYKLPIKKNGLSIPNQFYTTLSTWHKINLTYSMKYKLGLKSLRPQLKDFTHFERLETVVEEGLGFKIAILAEDTKIKLSNQEYVINDLGFIEANLEARVSQEDLQRAIAKQIDSIITSSEECIKKAGITRDAIDSIFLTGGSSQMTVLKESIEKHYNGIKIDNQDALSSVAQGLVIEAKNIFG